MTKVVHVANDLDSETGGPPVAIFAICAAEASVGITSFVAAPVSNRSSRATLDLVNRVKDVEAVPFIFERVTAFAGRSARWGISPGLGWWLFRQVGQFDVVIIHGAWSFTSVAALAATLFRGRPSIMMPHESLTEFDVSRQGSRLRIYLKSILKKLYVRHCRLVIFASQRERKDSVSADWRARTSVIYHGVANPSETFRPRTEKVTAALTLGFLGRLHEKKNLDRLLLALAAAPPHALLIVGGDGPPALRQSLHELADALGLSSRVRWLGFVEPDQKDSFFAMIDVLVMPSAYESFGLVAAEALVRGVPAIVSPRTGIAEIIERYGGGVISEIENLADAITELSIDHVRLRKLSHEALAAAERALSISNLGVCLKREYVALLDAKTETSSTRKFA